MQQVKFNARKSWYSRVCDNKGISWSMTFESVKRFVYAYTLAWGVVAGGGHVSPL